MKDWELRREVREEGRRGVDGREGGLLRVADVERFAVGGAVAGVAMAVESLGQLRRETDRLGLHCPGGLYKVLYIGQGNRDFATHGALVSVEASDLM